MKYFILLLLLFTSCLPTKTVDPQHSKIIVLSTASRIFLEDNSINYIENSLAIQVLFQTRNSVGLQPVIYYRGIGIINSGRVDDIGLSVPHRPETNRYYEWIISVKPRTEGTLILIFEGKPQTGDRKVIHFRSKL